MKWKQPKVGRKTFVLAGLMLLVGFVLLCFAIYYQQRVAKNNEFLSKMVGKSIPGVAYDFIVSFNASIRTTIPLLATIGIMLCIVGGFLLFLPRKMILSFRLNTFISKRKRKTIPRDVAIAVFNWAVFTVWIMLVSTGFIAYSPMIDSVAIVVGLALSSYTTWLGIRAYRKWRLKK